MSISLGDKDANYLYLGPTKILRAYLGNNMIYKCSTIYLDFLKNGQAMPSQSTLGQPVYCKWSDIGDYYRLTIELYTVGAQSTIPGLFRLFSNQNDSPLFDSSKGNYTLARVSGDLADVLTMDRAFNNATAIDGGFYNALINWINSNDFNIQNMNQAFANLGTKLDNAYDLYLALSTKPSIQLHSSTFAGSGTTADRALIPIGWGGDLAPAATTMASTVQTLSNNKTIWLLDVVQPDWTNAIGLYLFTMGSVSSYAGVSMNRTRITNKINNLQTSTSANLYFRPAFIQFNSGSSGAFSWLFTTTGINGHLSPNQANTDMPGTLDYDNYGVFDKEYGTYDSNKSIYFCFLVTNADPDSWTGFTMPYGLLFNSNYLDTDFKWFLQ